MKEYQVRVTSKVNDRESGLAHIRLDVKEESVEEAKQTAISLVEAFWNGNNVQNETVNASVIAISNEIEVQ